MSTASIALVAELAFIYWYAYSVNRCIDSLCTFQGISIQVRSIHRQSLDHQRRRGRVWANSPVVLIGPMGVSLTFSFLFSFVVVAVVVFCWLLQGSAQIPVDLGSNGAVPVGTVYRNTKRSRSRSSPSQSGSSSVTFGKWTRTRHRSFSVARAPFSPEDIELVFKRLYRPIISLGLAVGVATDNHRSNTIMASAAEQLKDKKKNRLRGRFLLSQTGSLDGVAATSSSGKYIQKSFSTTRW